MFVKHLKSFNLFKPFIALTLLNFTSSCQVVEMGVPGITGLATYPVHRLKEAFQDGVEDFHETTLAAKEVRQSEDILRDINNSCLEKKKPSTTSLGDIEDIQEALRLRECLGCVPLGNNFSCDDDISSLLQKEPYRQYSDRLAGNCCTDSCEDRCERLCPETFEILTQARERSIPYQENNLDITNGASDFGNPIVFGGYCHGIAAVRRSLATLAQFDASKPIKFANENQLDEFEEFYSDLIRKIVLYGQVKTIPGFKNMFDFTKDPRVKPLLQKAIQDSFAEQNFYNPFLLESSAIVDKLDEEEFKSELEKIQMHIKAQGTAQISFGKGGLKGHTVEVYHTEEVVINNKKYTKMCIIDSNDSKTTRRTHLSKYSYESILGSPPSKTYCPNSIDVDHGDWSYKVDGTIYNNSFHVDRHTDRLLRRNIAGVKEHCEKQRGCD